MKRIFFILMLSAGLATACGNPGEEKLDALAKRVFDRAAVQARVMDERLPEGMTPRSLDTEGKPVNAEIRWWCSGFYPGSLWYIYRFNGDEQIRALAEKHTARLDSLIDRKTDHDIGFQINCSYGNGRYLHPEYDAYMLRCAEKLASRFSPVTGVIKSWDNPKWAYPVIIDNMMNLELLMEEARRNGRDDLKQIAYSHADKTLKNHFREDYSTFHLVNYSPEDGTVLSRQTVQGYADSSAWARGQAWALYGYTMMAREAALAGDRAESGRYLSQAGHIARYLLGRLPEDGIPYWDFDAPDIPDALRDASAGAIMASAFAELSERTADKALSRQARKMALTQVRTLASDTYLAREGTNGGFLLKHSVGNMNGPSEVDVPLTYADYYFLEALLRLTKK